MKKDKNKKTKQTKQTKLEFVYHPNRGGQPLFVPCQVDPIVKNKNN